MDVKISVPISCGQKTATLPRMDTSFSVIFDLNSENNYFSSVMVDLIIRWSSLCRVSVRKSSICSFGEY